MTRPILIDGRGLYGRRTGMGRYLARLVEELCIMEELQQTPQWQMLWNTDDGIPTGVSSAHVAFCARQGSFAQFVTIPAIVRRMRCGLYHYPHLGGPMPQSCPVVVTCADIEPLMAPALFPRKLVWFYKLMVKRLQRAEVIITISEFSKKDIIAYTGIPASRVRVIYLGVESHFAPLTSQPALADILSRYELKPKQFVLYVGNTMPHKNVRRTAEAVKIVRCKYPGIVLAVAGARDRYRADLEKAVMDMGVSDGVRFLGPIPEDELPLLYNAAAVFIFPSLYEGFGLPVLEAMACGTPVVTSNAASLPEVVGDAAITIDPRSSEAIATAVQSVLEDPCLAAELSRRGVERARGFSWKRAAEQHLSVYREVLR